MIKKLIPEKTVQRLLLYYRYLNFLLHQGTKNVSSQNLAGLMESRDSQVRKDLSYFGRLGKRGSGYDVLALRDKIAVILDIEAIRKVCIVGMGSLGSALAGYKGFDALGFEVLAVFDNAEQKIGRKIRGIICRDIKEMSKTIRALGIELAILTVPAEAAQETAVKLEQTGIKAVLNFTTIKLSLSRQVKIKNIDLAMELKTLSFFMQPGP